MKNDLSWSESKKVLKELLKKNFPNVNFRLTKHHYDTLDIDYSDYDLQVSEVGKVVASFEGKSFDGMEDYESIINTGYAFGYIFVNREITEDQYKRKYETEVKGNSYDGVLLDMEFDDFVNYVEFYEKPYLKLQNYGIAPYNFLYRLFNK